MNMNRAQDYRQWIRAELGKRRERNPRYSLRCFARDLSLSPPRLSDVLRGRYGLSREAAKEVALRLRFTEEETARFCDLVEAAHGRSRAARDAAKERLRSTASLDQGGNEQIIIPLDGAIEGHLQQLVARIRDLKGGGGQLVIDLSLQGRVETSISPSGAEQVIEEERIFACSN